VTFAKKMQACGFYYLDDLKVDQAYRHFNTWLGDPVRALIAAKQNEVIARDNLVEHTAKVGDYLRSKLQEISY